MRTIFRLFLASLFVLGLFLVSEGCTTSGGGTSTVYVSAHHGYGYGHGWGSGWGYPPMRPAYRPPMGPPLRPTHYR